MFQLQQLNWLFYMMMFYSDGCVIQLSMMLAYPTASI